MPTTNFRAGQRVRLKACPPCEDFPEGLPAEAGVVLAVQTGGVVLVRVDERYRDPEGDDGLREVLLEQIER